MNTDEIDNHRGRLLGRLWYFMPCTLFFSSRLDPSPRLIFLCALLFCLLPHQPTPVLIFQLVLFVFVLLICNNTKTLWKEARRGKSRPPKATLKLSKGPMRGGLQPTQATSLTPSNKTQQSDVFFFPQLELSAFLYPPNLFFTSFWSSGHFAFACTLLMDG